jgi:hypothetical protein
MDDPAVFYNQEDLWVRATEKYHARIIPLEPYYVMWKPEGSEDPVFTLILPFTPKNRQVLIGWIAGLCDPQEYGRFVAYKFPKEKRVLGPQQVETKIDQDRYLSAQLSLWDQRGSQVIRGNVLAIPVEDTLLYVEPIYLQAETAAYPELRLVCVMHGDRLGYGESFDEALRSLFGPDGEERERKTALRGLEAGDRGEVGDLDGTSLPQLARHARDAFDRHLRLLGEKRFGEAAAALEELRTLLEEMAGRESPAVENPD